MIYNLRFFLIVAVFACTNLAGQSYADEVVLDEQKSDDIFVGDFHCASSRVHPAHMFRINPGKTGISAGELWTHFKNQGIDSMDHLVICMDVDPNGNFTDVGVEQVELTIEDPFDRAILTSYSLDRGGDNSLILPGYEASSFRPEATMKIDLGFDFMEAYSESSTQKIYFDVQMDDQSTSNSSFYIASNDDSYATFPSLMILGLFTAFWIAVFGILFLLTNPEKSKQTAST